MSFFRERRIKSTRVDRTCAHCNKPLPRGSAAINCTGLTEDGELDSFYGHVECRNAEVAWNKARGTDGDEFDWLWAIHEDDEAERWIAWLREHHPIAAERLLGGDEA